MNTTKINILIVDDDRNTRLYIAKILSGNDWNVDTAPDGAKALAMARKRFYHVVILDYRMPGMNGAEVCWRIKKIRPEIRGLFLTGFPTINHVFPAMNAGAERVLSKPVNPEELVRAVQEELAEMASTTEDRTQPDREKGKG